MGAADQSRIYSQRGSNGKVWKLDRQQLSKAGHACRLPASSAPRFRHRSAGGSVYKNHALHAAPRLADELNYKSINVAVERWRADLHFRTC